jgi:hypothetical protein
MLSKSSRTYLIRVVILKIFASVELDIVQDADRLDALAMNCSMFMDLKKSAIRP